MNYDLIYQGLIMVRKKLLVDLKDEIERLEENLIEGQIETRMYEVIMENRPLSEDKNYAEEKIKLIEKNRRFAEKKLAEVKEKASKIEYELQCLDCEREKIRAKL